MNRIQAVAIMAGALVGATLPLTLVNIHVENENRALLVQERNEAGYYECTKNLLSYMEKDGVRTYFSDRTGKLVTDKRFIRANEQTEQECNRLYKNKKD